MTAGDVVLLAAAGIGAGLAGSIAGLASLFSYPALLAVGLPPVTANVTNTVSLVCAGVGSVTASRPELAGQRRRVCRLGVAAVAGGITGGVLLLVTPAEAFEKIVPWLLAAAAIGILVRRPLVVAQEQPRPAHDGHLVTGGVALVAIYGGYFGAGAGVMLLAMLLWTTTEPLPRANAVKNVLLGVANAVAALAFVVFGDVRWAAVVPLGIGVLLGSRTGPVVVRHAPAGPIRAAIALAGLTLAIALGIEAYA